MDDKVEMGSNNKRASLKSKHRIDKLMLLNKVLRTERINLLADFKVNSKELRGPEMLAEAKLLTALCD